MTQRTDGGTPGAVPSANVSSCQYAVGRPTTVTCHAAHCCRNIDADASMASDRITTVDPHVSGAKISSTLASKLIDANCSMLSAGVNPYSAPANRMKLTAERCSISVPFGDPVVPDV